MRQVITIPADKPGIGGVFKKNFQRRRFNVAIAKYNVGFGQMAGLGWGRITKPYVRVVAPEQVLSGKNLRAIAMKAVADRHHCTWIENFRLVHGRSNDGRLANLYHMGNSVMSAQTQ